VEGAEAFEGLEHHQVEGAVGDFAPVGHQQKDTPEWGAKSMGRS
jgi:hypothetical protein